MAVVVKNSSTSALMSDYCDSVVSAMNLFAGGDGTQEDPYQITSAEQFNNIKYRLTKDGKNNSYYPCTINAEGEVIISDEIYNVDSANEIYHFVQTTHLEITKEYALANYQEESVNYEFNGVYDGAMYSLTLVWNENIDSESTISSLTIFEKVGVNGVLKNINVQLNLDNITIGKQISISVLAKNNYGTITNIIAGKLDVVSENVVKTISISNLEYSIDLSYVAYNNYGLIEKVETFYNTTITATSNNAVIGFGSVAISNLGGATISSVKNYGNLQISAGRVNVGGVVQYMQANSLTTQVANIGNIKVYLTSRIASTIGGIVGGCANGSLSYVYSVCDITIYSPSTVSINAYVGGIAGSMSGDAIEYSYSNITKNAKIESEFESYVYEGIYQIVGNLTQVSSSTSKAKYVYYNQLFNASSGTIPSGFIACTGTINSSNAKGLLNDGSKFADQAGNLVLTWETEFEKQIWIGFPEVEEQ